MRETLKTPLPLSYEIVMASDNALCVHSIYDFFKAGDIGTDNIVAFKTVFLCRLVNVVVQIHHNTLEFRINPYRRQWEDRSVNS